MAIYSMGRRRVMVLLVLTSVLFVTLDQRGSAIIDRSKLAEQGASACFIFRRRQSSTLEARQLRPNLLTFLKQSFRRSRGILFKHGLDNLNLFNQSLAGRQFVRTERCRSSNALFQQQE